MSDQYEKMPTRERKSFGRHEIIEEPLDRFVRLPQVRANQNPELPALKQSIQSTERLINQIDVVRMDTEALQEYLNFVNEVWKTDVSIESFKAQKGEDGMYLVVVAGHSRMEALHQLQQEDPDYEYTVYAKVHDAATPEEIIDLQLAENIHSQPPKERQAMAIVETYMYGKKRGLWDGKAGYMRQSGGRFGRKILDEALNFAELPPEALDFVFSGQLSFTAAVELGKGSGTIKEYARMRLGDRSVDPELTAEEVADKAAYQKAVAYVINQVTDWNIRVIDEVTDVEEIREDPVDQAYRQEVALLINRIFILGLNGPAARNFIKGNIDHMKERTDQTKKPSVQPELFLMSAEDQGRAYLKQLTKELADAKREMGRLSNEAIGTVNSLTGRLIGEQASERVEEEFRESMSLFGRGAVQEAVRLVG